AVDRPVLASGRIFRPEDLDSEMTRKLARGRGDPLEELLVGGLVPRLHAPGHGRRNGTAPPIRGGGAPCARFGSHVAFSSLSCSNPIVVPCGSTSQAGRAKPTSAIPSTVLRPGSSYFSTSMPCERSSRISAARSSTRHDALVATSLVPVLLSVTTRRL